MIVLNIIAYVLILLFGCLCFAGGCFFSPQVRRNRTKPVKPTEDELRRAQLAAIYERNFYTYDGDEQSEPLEEIK